LTAASKQIPSSLLKQLKVGEKMILPLEIDSGEQVFYLVKKPTPKKIQSIPLLPVRFVPLL